MRKNTYIESIRDGLSILLTEPDVFLLGEDIAEPYGGAFKVSKGLSKKYPYQVINMPMSEQTITGMAVGMSLAGLKPVAEIMFGDFVTLTMDQLLNHASKFIELFQKKLNLVIRTPMGGYRGYGATHSQSLEKLYFGLPNIFVIAPSIIDHPGGLLRKALNIGYPVLFIENKVDYPKRLLEYTEYYELLQINSESCDFPINQITIKNEAKTDYTIITYGGLVEPSIVLQNKIYFEEEINIKIITISLLSPINFDTLYNYVKGDNKIIIIEEGHVPYGIGDTIVSQLFQRGYKDQVKTIGAKNSVILAAEDMEKSILPNYDHIYNILQSWE